MHKQSMQHLAAACDTELCVLCAVGALVFVPGLRPGLCSVLTPAAASVCLRGACGQARDVLHLCVYMLQRLAVSSWSSSHVHIQPFQTVKHSLKACLESKSAALCCRVTEPGLARADALVTSVNRLALTGCASLGLRTAQQTPNKT